MLHAKEVPPRDNAVPLATPRAPEVNQGIPRNLKVLIVPVAPVGIQAIPSMAREDLLYE